MEMNRKLAILITSPKKKGIDLQHYCFNAFHSKTGEEGVFFLEAYVACGQERFAQFRLCRVDVPMVPVEVTVPLTDLKGDDTGISVPRLQSVFSDTKVAGIFRDRRIVYHLSRESDPAPWVLRQRGCTWESSRPRLEGRVTIDADTWVVDRGRSFTFCERLQGDQLPSTWFTLFGSSLQSGITGEAFPSSFFLVRGVFNKKIALTAHVNGLSWDYKPSPMCPWGPQQHFSCNITDSDIHWAVSHRRRNTIVDVDVSCPIDRVSMLTYKELADGKALHLFGTHAVHSEAHKAEVRVYRPVAKTIELIEYATSGHGVCKYGERG
jgi:hypothetical protein